MPGNFRAVTSRNLNMNKSLAIVAIALGVLAGCSSMKSDDMMKHDEMMKK